MLSGSFRSSLVAINLFVLIRKLPKKSIKARVRVLFCISFSPLV